MNMTPKQYSSFSSFSVTQDHYYRLQIPRLHTQEFWFNKPTVQLATLCFKQDHQAL